MKITPVQLTAIMPNVDQNWAIAYADAIVEAAGRFEINTPDRMAMWLANIAYESGELLYWEEIGKGNGAFGPYYGRGPLQLTHRENYKRAGEAIGRNLLLDPDLVARDTLVGFLTAAWFWRNGNGDLNVFADAGNLYETYKRILGGDNGTFLQRKKYYDRAIAALQEPEEDPGYLTLHVGIDEDEWAIANANGAFLKSELKNATLYSDGEGWIYWAAGTVEKKKPGFSWPVANDTPIPYSSWYTERCPTRYSWPGNRDDVNAVAVRVVTTHPCSVNTYHRHPEEVFLRTGVSREYDSFDVWGLGGRGDPLPPALGDKIFRELLNDPAKPDIEWIIWRRQMYGAWNNWQGEYFGSDPFSWHDDHIHVTYRR